MVLRARALTFAYRRGRPALRGVDARFDPGVLTAIVGPNGAGKSTLLRLCLGLLEPSSGETLLDDRALGAIPEPARAAHLAYIPQRPGVPAGFSAREVVGFGAAASGRPGVSGEINSCLVSMELSPLAERPFESLSQGQQQRVVVARALCQVACGARALLADEPTSAMDPRYGEATLVRLRELARTGVVVAAALHDLNAAFRHADQVLVLDGEGRSVAQGPTREVLTPERLARVFETRFDVVDGPRGPQAIPAYDRATP